MSIPVTCFCVLGEKPVLEQATVAMRPLQPDDVVLRVVASGVCHSDVHQIKSEWKGVGKARPLVPGHEIIGVVTRAGERSVVKPGMRVGVGTLVGCCFTCESCKAGEESYCPKGVDTYTGVHAATGIRTHGGFAEQVVVDSRFCFAIPDSLPSETAAPMLCAGITVYSPLRRWCTPQSAVAIVGIGGLGHLALQFARALGMSKVAAITTSKDKADAAMKFGATDVIVSSSKADMKRFYRAFDFLLVTVSSDLPWSDYLRLLRTGGRLCLVGLPPSGKLTLVPFEIVGRRLSVCGSNTGGLREISEMLDLAARASVRTQVELLPLSAEGANEAVHRVEANTPRFRCVMVPKANAL